MLISGGGDVDRLPELAYGAKKSGMYEKHLHGNKRKTMVHGFSKL